jgi:paraquat-inducible protein B
VAEVGQLRLGNTVKYRGVAIGKVDGFELEADGEAIRVRLLLDRELPPIEDPGAVVAPESLFGEWQVEIVSRARFPRYEYLEVEEGDAQEGRPLVGGYTLPDITRLTAAANEISENLAVLTDRVDRAFNDSTAANVSRAIDNIEDVSENLRLLASSSNETFQELRGSVSQATEDIGAAAAVARSSLTRVDELLGSGRMDSIMVSVERGSRDLALIAGTVAESEEQLAHSLERADSVLTRLDRLARRVEEGEGFLGQLMADSVLSTQAYNVLLQLDLLLADLRENPSRYVRLSIF